MGALEYVDVPGYAAIIFRRTFTDLALPGAIMARSKEWLAGTDATWNEQQKRWSFPSGAVLQFAYMDKPDDELRYQSAEFQFVGFDELTQFPEEQYTYLFSRLRRPDLDEVRRQLAAIHERHQAYRELAGKLQLARVPLRMRAASNPGGIGHGWVKKRFPIDPADGPKERRVFIPAKIADNPHLDATSYRAGLARLGDVRQRQLEDGDWQVAEGLAFRIDRAAHLIPPIEIPDEWERFESMDFGVANPTCVLAWATDYDGNLIVFDSYYQADTLISDHAAAIEAKRKLWWPSGQLPVSWADPSMWARNGRTTRWGEPASDVTEFEDHGVHGLMQANNRRRPGKNRVAELLKIDPKRPFPHWHPLSGHYGAPRLFVVRDACPDLVDQLEAAPLNQKPVGDSGIGEIIDPEWESKHGHATAALRYGAMSRPDPSVEPPVEPDDERERMARRMLERVKNNTGLMPV